MKLLPTNYICLIDIMPKKKFKMLVFEKTHFKIGVQTFQTPYIIIKENKKKQSNVHINLFSLFNFTLLRL